MLLIFISFSTQAKKELIPIVPQFDSIRRNTYSGKNTASPTNQQKNLYKMPSAKPKGSIEYSSLKDKRADLNDYRMLNSITPEKPQKEMAVI